MLLVQGLIRIEEPGEYNFTLESDDGAQARTREGERRHAPTPGEEHVFRVLRGRVGDGEVSGPFAAHPAAGCCVGACGSSDARLVERVRAGAVMHAW